MTAKVNKNLAEVFRQLKELGLLLVTGDEMPSVRRIISGKNSKGSWWADSSAQEIFAVNQQLEDHADVVVTKLVSNKVTFVHRNLWDKIFAIGTAREHWQLHDLSQAAHSLLKQMDDLGSLRTDQVVRSSSVKTGELVKELELRLLVHADQIHTESGAHAKVIETWQAWARRVNFKPRSLTPGGARRSLEKQIAEINSRFSGSGKLPWF